MVIYIYKSQHKLFFQKKYPWNYSLNYGVKFSKGVFENVVVVTF